MSFTNALLLIILFSFVAIASARVTEDVLVAYRERFNGKPLQGKAPSVPAKHS